MKILTPPCMMCGKTSEMDVDSTAYFRWQEQRWLIQTAFPDMPAPEREQLKTGTHPACWDEMFKDDEDDEPCEWGHTERPCPHDVEKGLADGTWHEEGDEDA